MPKITRSKLNKIVQEEVEKAVVEEGIGDRLGAAWKGLTGKSEKSGKSGKTDMSNYPEEPSDKEKEEKEAGYKKSAEEWRKTKEKWLKRGLPPQSKDDDDTSAPDGSPDDSGDDDTPPVADRKRPSSKPGKGRLVVGDVVKKAMSAAGIDDEEEVKKAIGVIKATLKQAVGGEDALANLPLLEAQLGDEGRKLFKLLKSRSALRGIPPKALAQIALNLSKQLAINKDLIRGGEEAAEEPAEEEAAAEETAEEEAGAEEEKKEEEFSEQDLPQLLNTLENLGDFDPKEFKKTMLGQVFSKFLNIEMKKFNKAIKQLERQPGSEKQVANIKKLKDKIRKPVDQAYAEVTNLLDSLYSKLGRPIAENKIILSPLAYQMLAEGIRIYNQPQTINESYTKRSHLIGDKLMKKWNLNS